MEVFTFGERLMIYRTRAGLTKKEVAERVGTTVGNITRYETDKAYPDDETMRALSHILGVTINRMAFGFDDPEKNKKKEDLINEAAADN
ncbi:MAG: helix-turn-helix domain-containing protein [Oscillospiraceae bacterium]|nr:helix-turn-helix domain-containing protein [Oscillospiraceae bacterium]